MHKKALFHKKYMSFSKRLITTLLSTTLLVSATGCEKKTNTDTLAKNTSSNEEHFMDLYESQMESSLNELSNAADSYNDNLLISLLSGKVPEKGVDLSAIVSVEFEKESWKNYCKNSSLDFEIKYHPEKNEVQTQVTGYKNNEKKSELTSILDGDEVYTYTPEDSYITTKKIATDSLLKVMGVYFPQTKDDSTLKSSSASKLELAKKSSQSIKWLTGILKSFSTLVTNDNVTVMDEELTGGIYQDNKIKVKTYVCTPTGKDAENMIKNMSKYLNENPEACEYVQSIMRPTSVMLGTNVKGGTSFIEDLANGDAKKLANDAGVLSKEFEKKNLTWKISDDADKNIKRVVFEVGEKDKLKISYDYFKDHGYDVKLSYKQYTIDFKFVASDDLSISKDNKYSVLGIPYGTFTLSASEGKDVSDATITTCKTDGKDLHKIRFYGGNSLGFVNLNVLASNESYIDLSNFEKNKEKAEDYKSEDKAEPYYYRLSGMINGILYPLVFDE